MRELGYDLMSHESKSLDDLPDIAFDHVATMGCGDACPSVKARRRADWSIPDPKHLPADEFRAVRDSIRDHVRDMLNELGIPSNVAWAAPVTDSNNASSALFNRRGLR